MNHESLHDTPLALHLADRSLAPLFSSANSDTSGSPIPRPSTQSLALSSLTSTAITAYDASLRFDLGIPLRIIVETHNSGPNLFLSYLNPPSVNGRGDLGDDKNVNEMIRNRISPLNFQENMQSSANNGMRGCTGLVNNDIESISFSKEADDNGETLPPPPLLVAMVVAPSPTDAPQAKKTVTQLARAGRECQRAWTRDHEEGRVPQVSTRENNC